MEKQKFKIFGNKFSRLTQWSALNLLNMYFVKLDTSCDNLQHYVQHKSAQSYRYKSQDWKIKAFEVWILFKHKYDAVLPIFRTVISLNWKFLASALPQAATTTNSNTGKEKSQEFCSTVFQIIIFSSSTKFLSSIFSKFYMHWVNLQDSTPELMHDTCQEQ